MPTAAPLDLVASIRGRRALVTGGSVGIGRKCVESLLAHGATVSLTYNRHVEEARSLAAAHPGRASCHFLDLRDPKSIVACFDEFQRRWGQLDVLVNNAAVGTATVAQYEPDPLRMDRALFEINAMGSFEVAQNGLRLMKAQAAGGPPRKLIDAELGHVDGPMGCEVSGIERDQRRGAARERDDALEIVHRAGRVRRDAEGHQPGSAVEVLLEPSIVEVGVGEHRDKVDRDPLIPQRQPGRDVRLVTGFGHQHPIARLPQARQRPADGEEVGGGVSPQAHLVGGCADQLRGRLVGLRSQLEAVLRPGEDFPSLEKAERM